MPRKPALPVTPSTTAPSAIRRRDALLALAALSIPGALGACKRKSDGNLIKLQLNWVPEPEFGGFYAAKNVNAFLKAGLVVEILGGGAGSPVVQLVASGQCQMGIAGASDVLIARERGAPIVAIYASFQHSPQGLMVRKSRGIDKLEDLKDGSLALEPGLPFAQWIRKKYAFSGVTIVPYDGGVAKFLADEKYAQQCFVTSEPLAAKKKGIETRVFSSQETGFDPYEACIVTSEAYLKANAAHAKAFVAAAREGWNAYLQNPAPANADMQKLNAAMDAATFAEAAEAQKSLIESAEAKGPTLGAMTSERWKRLGDQLVELGVIKKASPPEACFQNL